MCGFGKEIEEGSLGKLGGRGRKNRKGQEDRGSKNR